MAGPPPASALAERRAFVFFPNRYAHETWRGELLAPPVWKLLGECPRTEGRLAAFVTERAGLGPPAPAALDSAPARFCLLPWPAIVAVAQRLGLALNASRLGKVIDAKLVSRIRRELGAEAYEFALRRAPLITTQADPMAPDLASEAPLMEQFERSGMNYICLALAGLDAGLMSRFKLKLPRGHAALLDAPQGAVEPEAAWQVVRKVMREAEPEWSALLE